MATTNDLRKYNKGTEGNKGGGRPQVYKKLKTITTTVQPEVVKAVKIRYGKIADALRFCAAPGSLFKKEFDRLKEKHKVNQISIELSNGQITAYEVDKEGNLNFLEIIP